MDNFKYFFYCTFKHISPRKARLLFNNSTLSKTKRNNVLSKAGITLSKKSSIIEPFHFEFGRIELIGDVIINSGCVFLDNGKITILDNTMIGPNVTITTVSHHVQPDLRHKNNLIAPINIGENVWIGAGCVICPGVNIGSNSVIAANSVVTTNVPSNSLFAGAPAVYKKELITV